MADVQPLRALHYDLGASPAGSRPSSRPPYDVIDPAQRAALAARSPLQRRRRSTSPSPTRRRPATTHAPPRRCARWRAEGAVVRDDEPARLGARAGLHRRRTAGAARRRGFFARVRVEDYGPGRIRPHERTHPGPKEDRLRLTRATQANLSPIFSLYDDPDGAAWRRWSRPRRAARRGARSPTRTAPRTGSGASPTRGAIAAVQDALADAELLIADGHHRYETARVYAEEIGGEGDHRYVLMCLVALQDPGLTIFPTHRLLTASTDDRPGASGSPRRSRETSTSRRSPREELRRPTARRGRPLPIGYLDAHFERPFRLTLKDQAIADRALAGHARALPPPRHRGAGGAAAGGRARA